MDAVEWKVREATARWEGPPPPSPPETIYLDLAEHVVRQAAAYQDPGGMIGDPYNAPGVESVTATARFCAAAGHLIASGRCGDLLGTACRALDHCCKQVADAAARKERWPVAGFNLKDMTVLYEALGPLVPPGRLSGWTAVLRSFVPEGLYGGERNFEFYNASAETMRVKLGLSGRRDYADGCLARQMAFWTADGMYRDPGDPATYDLTSRQALAFMLENGYDGPHAGWARETLRRGALRTLLFVSPCGVAPFGGRSNQYHIMEAMTAYFAEWQAREEARRGDPALAGALRRMALAGTEAVGRWMLRTPYRCIKHGMDDASFFGQDGYHPGQNAHSGYGLLAANLFAGAHRVADRAVVPGSMPADAGGYVLWLPEAFHRAWAAAGGYHVQVDARAQPGYDATGLGRIHRAGAPIEAALNAPVPSPPKYAMPGAPAARPVALGAGWPAGDGWRYLAAAGRESHEAALSVERETPDTVGFSVEYRDRGGLGTPLVRERYRISADGVLLETEVPGAGRTRIQVPFIETDGVRRSEVSLGPAVLEVRYAGWRFTVRLPGGTTGGRIEPWPAPNRNGIHRVAVFEIAGPRAAVEASLAPS